MNTDIQDDNDALGQELDELMEMHESALVLVRRNDRQRREIVELNIQGNADANMIFSMEKRLLVLVGRNDMQRRRIVELRARIHDLRQATRGQRHCLKRQCLKKQEL